MSYEEPSGVFDREHINAAKVWIGLGVDVLFYRYQMGEFDVGDMIGIVSDLALRQGAEADVVLEDHCTYMRPMAQQPHFKEVLRSVYADNDSFRLAILTCMGTSTHRMLTNLGTTLTWHKDGPPTMEGHCEYENANHEAAGPNVEKKCLMLLVVQTVPGGEGTRGWVDVKIFQTFCGINKNSANIQIPGQDLAHSRELGSVLADSEVVDGAVKQRSGGLV